MSFLPPRRCRSGYYYFAELSISLWCALQDYLSEDFHHLRKRKSLSKNDSDNSRLWSNNRFVYSPVLPNQPSGTSLTLSALTWFPDSAVVFPFFRWQAFHIIDPLLIEKPTRVINVFISSLRGGIACVWVTEPVDKLSGGP